MHFGKVERFYDFLDAYPWFSATPLASIALRLCSFQSLICHFFWRDHFHFFTVFHRFIENNVHQEDTRIHTHPNLPIQSSLKSGLPATLENLTKVRGNLSVGYLQQGWGWPMWCLPKNCTLRCYRFVRGTQGSEMCAWGLWRGKPETVEFFFGWIAAGATAAGFDRMSKGNDDLDDQDISFNFLWRFEGGLKVLVQIRVKSPRIIINWSLRNPSWVWEEAAAIQLSPPPQRSPRLSYVWRWSRCSGVNQATNLTNRDTGLFGDVCVYSGDQGSELSGRLDGKMLDGCLLSHHWNHLRWI